MFCCLVLIPLQAFLGCYSLVWFPISKWTLTWNCLVLKCNCNKEAFHLVFYCFFFFRGCLCATCWVTVLKPGFTSCSQYFVVSQHMEPKINHRDRELQYAWLKCGWMQHWRKQGHCEWNLCICQWENHSCHWKKRKSQCRRLELWGWIALHSTQYSKAAFFSLSHFKQNGLQLPEFLLRLEVHIP